MTQTQKALQNKVDERARKINLLDLSAGTFPEIRELDYEIAGLQRLVEEQQRTTNEGGAKPSVRSL